jgi:outer membrane protein assembly factor BamB
MFRPILTVAATTLVLAACHESSTAPAAESTSDNTLTAIAPAPGRVKWRVKLQGDYSLHSPGIAADGTVYVSLPEGKIYAIAPDGSQKWIFQAGLGGGVYGPVSVAGDGTIYGAGLVPAPAGSGATGAIFALTPAGTVKWKFDATGNDIIAGPSIGPDGNIYAVAEFPGIGLFSLTPAGQLRWKTGSFGEYGPLGQEIAFGSGQLYFAFDMVGMGSPSLFGYSLAGAKRFQLPNPADNSQPDVGPNGNVVIESFPTGVGLSLTGYTPAGAIAWSYYRFPGNTQEHPDVGPDNTSYTVRNLGTLLALDAAGQERWRWVDTTIMLQPRVRPQNDLLFMGGRVSYCPMSPGSRLTASCFP